MHDQHWPAQFPEKFHYFVQVLPPVPCTCNILKEIGESGTKNKQKDKIIVRERKRERERERVRQSTREYEKHTQHNTTQHTENNAPANISF